MFDQRFQYVIILGFATLLVATTPASAQNALQGFFSQNGAQTPFSPDIDVTVPRETVMLKPKEELLPEAEEEKFAQQANPEASAQQPEVPTALANDRHVKQPSSPEEILKHYGDPSNPYPAAATEDAPAPFQAMYAAMNAGDDELAFKYAVQYMKFREQLKSQNKKAVSIMGHAQRKLGMLPEGSWPDSQSHSEYAYLQDTEVQGVDDETEAASQAEVNVTEETRKLISKLQETQFDLFNDKQKEITTDLKEWEEKERAMTRKSLAGKVPLSPTGKIDILVFLRSTQDESIALGPEVQRLYDFVKDKKNTNLAAFIVNSASESAIAGYRTRAGAGVTLPILPGTAIAKNLGLKVAPAVIFVTPEGKTHVEAGIQNFYRLDEIRKIMQGEKSS